MRFLLDTNCWMQLVRDREHAAEVSELLTRVPSRQIVITDYSLHSLLNITRRFGMLDALPAFVEAAEIGSAVEVVSVPVTAIRLIVRAVADLSLDVDDAYQYAAADIHGLRLVSFDTNFDRTPNGRLTPEAALRLFEQEQSGPNAPS